MPFAPFPLPLIVYVESWREELALLIQRTYTCYEEWDQKYNPSVQSIATEKNMGSGSSRVGEMNNEV
jgi:hypothetical protein